MSWVGPSFRMTFSGWLGKGDVSGRLWIEEDGTETRAQKEKMRENERMKD